MKIIISINPEHVENIIRGTKKYEYRTRVAIKSIDSILVYCTHPCKKVVAEVAINSVQKDTPERLWDSTKDLSGITKEFFDEYFKGRSVAYAYELGKVVTFEVPKELSEFSIGSAPQSYTYVNA